MDSINKYQTEIQFSEQVTKEQRKEIYRKLEEFLSWQSYAMASFQKIYDWLGEFDKNDFGKFFDGRKWADLSKDLRVSLSNFAKSAAGLYGNPAIKSFGMYDNIINLLANYHRDGLAGLLRYSSQIMITTLIDSIASPAARPVLIRAMPYILRFLPGFTALAAGSGPAGWVGIVASIAIGIFATYLGGKIIEQVPDSFWEDAARFFSYSDISYSDSSKVIKFYVKIVKNTLPFTNWIPDEKIDGLIEWIFNELGEPIGKRENNKFNIFKPIPKEEYEQLFRKVIDAKEITTLTVNGETFTINDAASSAIIRNNLNNIAPESFVTSHILIHPGEKLQLGNGKDYYTIKEHDTIAAIAKANGIKVNELVALNPWLADENRITFHRDKLIMPEGVSLIIDTHTNHEYGDEETRAVVAIAQNGSSSEKSSTRHLTSNINHPLSVSDTSAHDYFADFDGGDDKFYGSLKGGDTFAGGKGNDIYYINFNGERSDTIIDSEGKNELHVIDEKGNVVRLTGGSRNKDTMPERTFVSDDGHYVFHVDEHNMLSVLRAEDVKKAGDGDFSEGMKKIIANKKTRHNASKKQPAGGYPNNSGSGNAGASNAGGNHSNTGNSGSNHADSGKNQAGNPPVVPEPKEIRVPNFGNGGFGINLKDDPQEPDPFPSVPEPAPDSTPGYGAAPNISSPIIFDLNGDGVTTVAKDSDIVRFDLDNNGFAERTGWVNKYDGLLVRDLNGNGRIDNGGELFGNYTKLANGQMAANGFEALNDLDDNKDGQITAADTAWKTLRIWQDTNQDAHSAKGELSTLDELGITSISTKYQNSTEIDTAGNAHKQISSARRSDGSSIAVSDVWFTTHLADTSQKNKKTVSSEIALLPNIRSFGNVPDLHQAMIVNQKLKQAVETYLASNKKQRTAQIDSLIYLWTGVADVPANSRDIYIDARQLTALEALTGEPFLLLGSYPNPGPRAALILAAEYNKFTHYVAAHLDAYGNPLFTKYQDKESGREIYDFNKLTSYIQPLILDNKLDEIANISQIIQGLIAYDSYQKDLWRKNVHKFILSDYRWAYLLTSSYIEGTKSADALYGKASNEFINGDEGDDRLYGNHGDDVLNGGSGNDSLFGEDGNDTLIGGAGNDRLEGGSGSDTYVFGKGFGQDTIFNQDLSTGRKDIIRFTDGITADMLNFTREGEYLLIKAKDGSGQVTVQSYFQNDGSGAYRIDEIHFDNGKVLDVATVKKLVQQSTDGSDRLYAYQSGSTLNGGLGDDYLYGADGADTLNGGKGNDWLYGGNGNDMLNGDEGDDRLYGIHGDDVLNGGAGNDNLSGEDGNDTLIGGAGNDRLEGGSGSDTYVFGKGFGQDTIFNYDLSTGRKDIIRFTDGITADMLNFTREGEYLLIKAKDGSGQVTVQSYFQNDGSGAYRIDEIHFDNGKVLDVATVKKLVQQSTDGSDRLYAYQSGSTLNGGLGDDYLYGADGADTLNGGKGNDWLYGGNGNDMLNGDEGDDRLYGIHGDDVLNGGAGNDNLSGEDGNDTLIGGAGNDRLEGGSGSDTYVFGKGFGQDTIFNYDLSTGRKDIIRFTDGITADMLNFTREGEYLLIKAKDGSGQVTVQSYFQNDGSGAYRIDEIHFDNGKVLDVATVKKLVQQSTDGSDRLYAYQSGSTLNGGLGDDYLYGADGADTLNGGKGNDWLYGGNGNDMLNGDEGDDRLYGIHGDDVLNGGAGNDNLSGEDGNDTLIGGAGNDRLEGGSGSDTYVFGKGFGQDTVHNYHVDKNSDTMHFKGFKAADVHFIRSGSDLVLSTSEQDNVRISGFFYGENHRVDTFVFDDAAISNPDFAKYINAGNNLVQSMSVFGSNTVATVGNGDANTQSVQQPLLVTPSA